MIKIPTNIGLELQYKLQDYVNSLGLWDIKVVYVQTDASTKLGEYRRCSGGIYEVEFVVDKVYGLSNRFGVIPSTVALAVVAHEIGHYFDDNCTNGEGYQYESTYNSSRTALVRSRLKYIMEERAYIFGRQYLPSDVLILNVYDNINQHNLESIVWDGKDRFLARHTSPNIAMYR